MYATLKLFIPPEFAVIFTGASQVNSRLWGSLGTYSRTQILKDTESLPAALCLTLGVVIVCFALAVLHYEYSDRKCEKIGQTEKNQKKIQILRLERCRFAILAGGYCETDYPWCLVFMAKYVYADFNDQNGAFL